jgi:hypothetical protein
MNLKVNLASLDNAIGILDIGGLKLINYGRYI